MDNANSQEYLQKIKVQVIENLKRTAFAPSVQMTDVPRDPEGMNDEADAELDDLDEDENPDSRYSKRRWEKYVEKDGELSDSEDEEMNEANGVRKQPNGPKRRRNMMDFQNPMAVPDDNMASGAVSARSGRSMNGINGSGDHSNLDDSEGENFEDGEREDSLSSANRDLEDEDAEMADEPITNGGHAPLSTDGAQEATPPESPPAVAADATAPADVVEDTGNDAMDEGDTLDDPELAKEAGRGEREQEDIIAERATEVVEREEQS